MSDRTDLALVSTYDVYGTITSYPYMVERIVSFLPSATELIYELGAQDRLYGVTHECHFPKDAQKKPRVINSVIDTKNMPSKEIDDITTEMLRDGKDIFKLEEENLVKAMPDLIVSQNTCEVCAAHNNQVNEALQILDTKPQVYSMDPHNFSDILDSVTALGKLIGKEKQAAQLRQNLQKRIDDIKNKRFDKKPNVLGIEWIDPLFTSGHWVPEIIETAGGKNQISKVGEQSRRLELDEVVRCDPDIIVVMPCGFNLSRTVSEYKKTMPYNENWKRLAAVKNNKVFAVDANSYFSKPSIRTVTGLEIMAKIIHPEIFGEIRVPEDSFEQLNLS